MKVSLLTSIVLFVICIGASIIYGLFSFRFSGYPALIPLVIICWFIFKIVTCNRFWITRAVPYKFTKGLANVGMSYYIGMFLLLHICYGIAISRHSFCSEKIRFPISDVEWVSSRADGTIYCLSRAYSRLQIFDSTGKFVRGWFVKMPRGSYWISICDNGDIVLGKEGEKPAIAYDQFGECIEVTENHENVIHKEPATETYDQNGNTYKLKSDLFWPKIVKIDAKGVEQTVVKDPVGIWQHTLPFFFALLLFSVFLGAAASIRSSYSTAEQT